MQSGPINASLDIMFSTLESRLRDVPNFRGSPSRESKKLAKIKRAELWEYTSFSDFYAAH